MKVALLFLFALAGFASAVPTPEYAVFEDAADEVLKAFAEELDQIAPLNDETDETAEIQNELIDKLQEALKETLDKIKKRIDEEQKKADDLIKEAERIAGELKKLGADLKKDVREAFNRLSSKARQQLKRIMDLFRGGKKEKMSLQSLPDLHRRGEIIAERVCKALRLMVPAQRRDEVETTCKKHVMELTEFLEKLVNREHDNLVEIESMKDDILDPVKKFFRDLKLTFSKKYANFAEWLKEAYKKGLQQSKDKMEHLKEVAREIKKSAKEMKEEALKEAMEVLKPYKAKLGKLWNELVDAVKKAIEEKKEQKMLMLEKLE